MTQSNNEQPENKPAKKVWQKPDFYILDSNNINTGTHHGVHEKSFANPVSVPNGAPHYPFWVGNGLGPKSIYYS